MPFIRDRIGAACRKDVPRVDAGGVEHESMIWTL